MSKILVIDDDEALRTTLEAALHFFGYEVETVEDGSMGIERARTWLPDVILCDVNMPGMDGREVLQAMRNDPQLANRQIVLMTGNQTQNPQREGMNLGADDYLPKPFEVMQLRTCVEARLRRAIMYRRIEEGMLRRHADLFGSTLPHEFMTPLNGILGLSEILQEDLGKIPREESLQMLGDIQASARRLYRTLMNYITLINLENAPPPEKSPQPEELASTRVLQTVGGMLQKIAEESGRATDLTADLDPVSLRCHDADLRTIVEHLVANALGYSPAGTPVMVALKKANGHPTLEVVDRGRGMTAEQIDQIGVFTQFDRKRFEQQGLGIGLALVKLLLARNGGTLRIASALGVGTTAVVEFQPSA